MTSHRPLSTSRANITILYITIWFATSIVINLPLQAQKSKRSLIFLSHDNDILKITNTTDRYYSFGLTAGYQQIIKPDKLKFLPRLFKGTKYIGGFQTAIKGYTPTPQDETDGTVFERPFAGTLTVRPYLTSVNSNRLIRLDFEAGVRGPASQAGDFQNWVHDKIGDDRVEGWENQLHNKLLLNVYGFLAKPISLLGPLQVVSESSVALGNHFTNLQQGVKFRAGIFNSISNSVLYSTHLGAPYNARSLEIFATFSLYGRLSLVDATLENSVLNDQLSRINRDNLQGGYQLALNAAYNKMGFEAAYNKISPGTQLSEKHSYGTITLSYIW